MDRPSLSSMKGIVQTLSKVTDGRDVIVATGVGSHQSIVARYFTWDYPRRLLLTSCGHGTMGSGLPMAIGAAISRPDSLVLCINGDGSMNMDAPHLMTLRELQVPIRIMQIKIIVLDNASMGIVRQFEDLQGFANAATANRPNPDFAAIARASFLEGYDIEETSAWGELEWSAFIAAPGPALAHVRVDDYGVWPILEGGRQQGDMTDEPAG